MGSAATFDYIYLLYLFVIQRVQGMFMGDCRSRGHPGLWGTSRGSHWPAGNVGPLTNFKAHMHKYMIYNFFLWAGRQTDGSGVVHEILADLKTYFLR